jgi:hypothetical protein
MTDAPNEKHLEMIQAIISRMASNSFAYKALSLTLISAGLAFAGSTETPVILLGLVPMAFVVWLLDGFHLHTERRYRKLYDKAVEGHVSEYSLTPATSERPIARFIGAIFSKTLVLLYPGLILLLFGSYFALSRNLFDLTPEPC